jgi:hypothetical protein
MIGVICIPTTAPDYKGKPSRFLHGMPYRVDQKLLQNPVHSEAIARRSRNDSPTISLPRTHGPITSGTSQPGTSRGLRSESSKAKQLKRYLAYVEAKKTATLAPAATTAAGSPNVTPAGPAATRTDVTANKCTSSTPPTPCCPYLMLSNPLTNHFHAGVPKYKTRSGARRDRD